MEDTFLSIEEVVEYLKIPKSTIYKLSQKGQIPSLKIGKQLRFRKSSLDKWLIEKEQGSLVVESGVPNQKQILLIDDDSLVLKTLSRLLESSGYRVEPVQSGEEALERIRKLNFDLVITDIRMPGIDGIETIKRIRDVYRKSNKSPISEIIITGYIDTEAQHQAERLNISDYVHKPFAISNFLDLVRKKLEFAPSLN